MKYLVKQIEYYVDPHGSLDPGNTRKYVVDNLKEAGLDDISQDEYYDDKMIALNMDNVYPEDGYNIVVNQYKFIELSDTKAEQFKDIIAAYNQM